MKSDFVVTGIRLRSRSDRISSRAKDVPLPPAVVDEDFMQTTLRAAHSMALLAGKILEMLSIEPQTGCLDR